MNRMMRRTTLREIRYSLGRYLAIFAIVALGVGFFSGLKVTKEAMVHSVDCYLKETNFYDLRLLSTLGFEEEDIAAFSKEGDVIAAEGAISADVLCLDNTENESAMKVYSLPDTINQLVLKAGRMPENEKECVVDSNKYTEAALGTTIVFTENNNQDTLDLFKEKEYTIVGIVQSPCYLNFERGNTTIGSGRLAGFLYVSKASFECDYDTEIFIKLNSQGQIYSKQYEDYIDRKKEKWESLCEDRVNRRYEKLVSEAEDKLKDAGEELKEKKEEGEKQLEEALLELQNTEAEIEKGKKELAANQETLTKQRDSLNAQEKELKAQKEAVELQIQQMGVEVLQLAEAREQLEKGLEQLAAGKASLRAAKKTLDEKNEELQEAEVLLEEGREEYEEKKFEFEEKILEAEEEISDARKELSEIEKPDCYVLTRDSNVGYVCFENDSSIVEGIANVFPLFFFLVAALVCVTTMNRMVEEQRTQIGILKALGYSEKTIMGKYVFYSGSAAVSGCLLGFFGGTYLFPQVIWKAYHIMYNGSRLYYVFHGGVLAVSMAVALLCSVGTTWISSRYELFSVPATLMRPKAPRAGKRILLEKIPFIWSRLKFLHKVSIRNLFRYKKRFFMMVVGISGCTALLVTGFGIMDSVKDVATQQYEEIQIFHMGVLLKEGTKLTQEKGLTEALNMWSEEYCSVQESSIDIVIDEKGKAVNLVIAEKPEQFKEYVSLHTSSGKTVSYPEQGEIVICNGLARTLDLKVGDRITLRNEDYREIEVTVSGIFENFVDNYVYMSRETYEEQFGVAAEYRKLYINVLKGKEVHSAAAAFMNMDCVTSVTVNADNMERFTAMMDSLNMIIVVIIICAGCLAFIVLYNLTNINITERIREIATIKVLGFYRNETASYVFRENIILTAIGALVGLGLGKLLHLFVMSQIKIDMVSFDEHIKLLSYAYSLFFTFFFTVLVNLFMSHKLEAINMAESLKSVD